MVQAGDMRYTIADVPGLIPELLRLGHIDFVEDDDARAFGDRDRAEWKL